MMSLRAVLAMLQSPVVTRRYAAAFKRAASCGSDFSSLICSVRFHDSLRSMRLGPEVDFRHEIDSNDPNPGGVPTAFFARRRVDRWAYALALSRLAASARTLRRISATFCEFFLCTEWRPVSLPASAGRSGAESGDRSARILCVCRPPDSAGTENAPRGVKQST